MGHTRAVSEEPEFRLSVFNGRLWPVFSQRLVVGLGAAVLLALGAGALLGTFGVGVLLLAAPLFVVLASRMRGSIPASEAELALRGERASLKASVRGWSEDFALGDVREAWDEPAGTRWRVWVRLRGGNAYSFEVQRREDALAALHALRAGAEQRTFARGFDSVGIPLVLGLGLVSVGACSLQSLWGALAGLALTALLYALVRPLRVRVGAEGVELRVSVWRYFVRYDELVTVFEAGDEVTLVLTGERRARYFCPNDPHKRAAVVQRIFEAREAWARRGGTEGIGALHRGGRTVAAWREGLRALLRKGNPLRGVALTREDLLRMLEDARGTAEQRIGAALALHEVPDAKDEAREPTRVRVAVDACTGDALRAALDGAASGALTEAQVEAAVAEERARRPLQR